MSVASNASPKSATRSRRGKRWAHVESRVNSFRGDGMSERRKKQLSVRQRLEARKNLGRTQVRMNAAARLRAKKRAMELAEKRRKERLEAIRQKKKAPWMSKYTRVRRRRKRGQPDGPDGAGGVDPNAPPPPPPLPSKSELDAVFQTLVSSIEPDPAAPELPPNKTRTELSPAAEGVTLMDRVDLFNKLAEFGTVLVIDVRRRQDYFQGHVLRAVSLPLEGKLSEIPGLSEDVVTPEADARPLADHALDDLFVRVSSGDQRTFKLNVKRRGATIIIYGADGDASALREDTENPQVILARLVREANPASDVHILDGGYSHFNAKYDFIECSYNDKEIASESAVPDPTVKRRRFGAGGHKHARAFPWFPSEILGSALYLGSNVDAKSLEQLQKLKVTHVLNVTSELENHFEDVLQYKTIALDDEHTVTISQHFKEAIEFIDEARRDPESRVLVHCYQGVSRSATMVIAFLMTKFRWTLADTYHLVKSRRKQVFPNIGFWRQLESLEKALFDGKSTLADCVDMELLQSELEARQARSAAAKAEEAGGDKEEVEEEAAEAE